MRAAADAHVRPGRRADIEALDQRLEHAPRVRSLHGDHGPLFGGRGEPHLEVRPFGLSIIFHHRQHPRRAAGGGGDVEAVRRGSRHHAVVVHEAVFAQQYAVARTAHGQIRPVVDVHAAHELGGVGTDDFDLAQGRGVEQAAGVAHREALARHRGMHIFAAARKIARALPQADILEHRAARLRPGVGGGGAHRVEQVAARNAGQAAEGDGREGHAERGQSHLRQGHLKALGHDGHGVEIRGLALIGGHARGGVALDMLDGLKALARRQRQIARGHIVLPIDEGFLAARRVRLGQGAEISLAAARGRRHEQRRRRAARLRARPRRRPPPRPPALRPDRRFRGRRRLSARIPPRRPARKP